MKFENHITVAAAELSQFKNDCQMLDIKPVIVDMPLADGSFKTDYMTSMVYDGPLDVVHQEVNLVMLELTNIGYKVIRNKIEISARAEAEYISSIYKDKGFTSNQYFETHFEFLCHGDDTEGQLKTLCKDHLFYLSYNVGKAKEESKIVMLTVRYYGDPNDFFSLIKQTKDLFDKYNLPILKAQSEFAIYDSNPHHDDEWLSK